MILLSKQLWTLEYETVHPLCRIADKHKFQVNTLSLQFTIVFLEHGAVHSDVSPSCNHGTPNGILVSPVDDVPPKAAISYGEGNSGILQHDGQSDKPGKNIFFWGGGRSFEATSPSCCRIRLVKHSEENARFLPASRDEEWF